MPFSFNPTAQTGTQQSQAPQESSFNPGGPQVAPLADTPSVPDSPFLFIQQRGVDKTTGAYLQIVLATVSVLAVISSVTLFAYSFYLKKSLDSKKVLVEQSETSFKTYPYEEMKEVYKGIVTLESLLKEYAAGRTPLLLLERVVENEVLISKFSLAREVSGKYNLTLTAQTSNYKVLVQQLDALKLASYAKVAPSQKINKILEDKQNKNGQIQVDIVVPLNIQGVHPDAVIFENIVDTSRQVATSTPSIIREVEISTTTPN